MSAAVLQGKACRRCGSTERYEATGRCRHCVLAAAAAWRAVNKPPKQQNRGMVAAERRAALARGQTRFRSHSPCATCGGHERYTASGACYACQRRRRAAAARGKHAHKDRVLIIEECRAARAAKLVRFHSVNPCPNCGGTERYAANGCCRECQAVQRNARAAARPARPPKPPRGAVLSEERRAAIAAGQARFVSEHRCHKCGNRERYTSNGRCCCCDRLRKVDASEQRQRERADRLRVPLMPWELRPV